MENLEACKQHRGGGYTWYKNSRENRVSVWNNKTVEDVPSEAIYVCDLDEDKSFSLTPNPMGEENEYIVKFGFGYSKFMSSNYGLDSTLIQYIPFNDNVKVNKFTLKNNMPYKRNLKIVYFVNIGLDIRTDRKPEYIDVNKDDTFNIVYAENIFKLDFKNDFVYISSSEKILSYTGIKDEFLGAGNFRDPYGLRLRNFSNKSGIGKDNMVAIQLEVDLKENEEKEVSLILGATNKKEIAKDVSYKYYKISNCKTEFENVKNNWEEILNVIQVSTPCESTNIMLNGWLIYQTLSSRIWGRSGFYQSGGAFGFRDQLQDVLSLMYTRPDLTRKQIIEHAKHQFFEGDVEHWWHKETSKGIRTRFSDDLLWLPYVTLEYIKITNDFEILEEQVSYMEGDVLAEGEDEKYQQTRKSSILGNIYEHITKAIDKSLNFGDKGLPLMGSGDWNDGMNLVGNKGKGQSVWLRIFLILYFKKYFAYM